MEANFKRHLMSLMRSPDHGHPSMTECMACKSCGERFAKAKALYDRTRREHPELFTGENARKEPEYIPSQELKEDFVKLVERSRKDKLYRRHIEKLAYGTELEKDEEMKKSNKGYYTKHYEQDGKIYTIKDK